jgi:hypothetical protein
MGTTWWVSRQPAAGSLSPGRAQSEASAGNYDVWVAPPAALLSGATRARPDPGQGDKTGITGASGRATSPDASRCVTRSSVVACPSHPARGGTRRTPSRRGRRRARGPPKVRGRTKWRLRCGACVLARSGRAAYRPGAGRVVPVGGSAERVAAAHPRNCSNRPETLDPLGVSPYAEGEHCPVREEYGTGRRAVCRHRAPACPTSRCAREVFRTTVFTRSAQPSRQSPDPIRDPGSGACLVTAPVAAPPTR